MNRNVVLLVLDTVRKDYFDEHAPRLRERAELSYEGCRAASSWSTPSHASMMTGELPSRHGIHAHNVDFSGLRRGDTFLAELPEYTAVGVSTNLFAGTPFGFDAAFDEFTSISRHALFPDALDIDRFLRTTDRDSARRYLAFLRAVAGHDHPVKSVLNGLFLKLNDAVEPLPVPHLYDYGTRTVSRTVTNRLQNETEPVFLFANYMEAHTPLRHTRLYDGSIHDVTADWSSEEVDIFELNDSEDPSQYREYRTNFREIYAAAIRYLDRQVDALVDDILRATGRETTVIVTSDHGENLGAESDDHIMGHVGTLTDGTLHVPLEVINPPVDSTEVVSEYVSHLDLPELIVGLARGEVPDIRREVVPAERIGLGLSHEPDNYAFWDRMLRCTYRDETKYEWDSLGNRRRLRVESGRPSWQELAETDVTIPDWARSSFDEVLDDYKRMAEADAASSTDEMDAHTRDQLEDLGYL